MEVQENEYVDGQEAGFQRELRGLRNAERSIIKKQLPYISESFSDPESSTKLSLSEVSWFSLSLHRLCRI